MPSTILTTQRLKLRSWRTGDEPAVVKYANNRKISIHLRDRFPYPYTETDAHNWVSYATQGAPVENFAIELLDRQDGINGEPIGGVGLILGEDVFRRTAEIGYWLGEPFWGQGIMTEALSAVAPYAFQAFSLTRLFAGVFHTNPASARVLEKAGFTLESRMRKAVVKENQVLDQLMYVMIR